ncbi:MAG: glutamine--fructose-6-phosphate transaminase (isomerizing) [Eubacteriaceae bacterium]|nr:glutamine--fructose-6-phosphate transaminase (isomerizing) [Eubacteriaceae bacterium]
MCGIVGYIGRKSAQNIILSGLNKLEYRGYDSAGIAVKCGEEIIERKFKGRLSVLEGFLCDNPVHGNIGIGHTRWATHGAPSDENAHPHSSTDYSISVVHNGIIENYVQIKEELTSLGYVFRSQTDTEVAAHLIHHYYEGDLLDAFIKAVGKLKGAYALVAISEKEEKIVCVRKDSPLIIGLGENESFVASDIPAVLEYTRDVYLMDDNVFAELTHDGVSLCDENKHPVQNEVYHVTWDAQDATKGGYEHFMLKEIFEQPTSVRNTLRGRLDKIGDKVTLDDFRLTKEDFNKISKVYIVACGTAYYAGCIGKYLIEKYARKTVETDVASEFRYKDPIIDENTLFIAISQSGETADTLAGLRYAKKMGAKVLSITNVVGSSVARESENVLYTWAGPEIAVASTKAFSTQIIAMYLLAIKFGLYSGNLSEEKADELIDSIYMLDKNIETVLGKIGEIEGIAHMFESIKDAFFIGRGVDHYLSMEGSLKMKEISYIHAEAYQAGELKHGPIALLEEGSVVVCTLTYGGELCDKVMSNLKEVKARGAKVVLIAEEGNEDNDGVSDVIISLPKAHEDMNILPAAVVLQLLAYYSAVNRGCDVDKPRNLAKSVTVE